MLTLRAAVLRRKAQVLEDMPVRTGVNATRFQHCTITLVLKQRAFVMRAVCFVAGGGGRGGNTK